MEECHPEEREARSRRTCSLPAEALPRSLFLILGNKIPIRYHRQLTQLLRELRHQHTLWTTPAPVVARLRRHIHPRLRAKLQNVLKRKEADVRDRRRSSANQWPHHPFSPHTHIRLYRCLLDLRRAILPPAACRVVIVRAG